MNYYTPHDTKVVINPIINQQNFYAYEKATNNPRRTTRQNPRILLRTHTRSVVYHNTRQSTDLGK